MPDDPLRRLSHLGRSSAVAVGTVAGPMALALVVHRFRGGRALLASSLVAIVILIWQLARAGTAPRSLVVSGAIMLVTWTVLLRLGRGVRLDAERCSVPLRRFQIKSVTGQVFSCRIEGDLVGAEVRNGDCVRVTGRRGRDGQYRVRRIEVLAKPGGPVNRRITGRLPFAFRFARWLSRLASAAAALTIVWSVALLAAAAFA